MGHIDKITFNANSSDSISVKGNGTVNNYTVISSRSGCEGPEYDTFECSSKKSDEPNFLGKMVKSVSKFVMGDAYVDISFTAPQKRDDVEGLVISDPFDAPDEKTAKTRAAELYGVSKGKVQKNTGYIYQGISAVQLPDGKYVATAGGGLNKNGDPI